MRDGKNFSRMREDVRPAEICFAALGGDVFKATCRSKYGNAGGSAALASSAARGTRQQLSAKLPYESNSGVSGSVEIARRKKALLGLTVLWVLGVFGTAQAAGP